MVLEVLQNPIEYKDSYSLTLLLPVYACNILQSGYYTEYNTSLVPNPGVPLLPADRPIPITAWGGGINTAGNYTLALNAQDKTWIRIVDVFSIQAVVTVLLSDVFPWSGFSDAVFEAKT